MIILIDLDGTLTDTAHEKFKPFKDGKQQTVLSDIPLIQGAKEFIADIQVKGHKPIIISDSHPDYVNLIAKEIFKIPAVNLTDKPNIERTANYIQSNQDLKDLFANKDNFIMVGQTSYADCLHIALATIHRADFLVSWNFKHIVNIERIRGYNAINIKNGYKQLEIRSPREFEKYEDD